VAIERKEEPKPALGADLLIPALALGFAIYFFISIADLTWEAKANGILIGVILVTLIAIQAARVFLQVARREAVLGFDRLLLPRDALPRRIGMVVLTAVFIATMPWLGLTLGLLIAMAVGQWLLGVRNPRSLALVSFGVAAFAYVMFIVVLDTAFPHGPIENVMKALAGLFRA
jgi:hypothetical protein